MLKIERTYTEVLRNLREKRGDGHIVYIDDTGSMTLEKLLQHDVCER